jgi:hypothetical protein
MDMDKDTLVEKDCILAVQEGLLGFLLVEVRNPTGKHYYDGSLIEKLA